jgi:hypothetical protein
MKYVESLKDISLYNNRGKISKGYIYRVIHENNIAYAIIDDTAIVEFWSKQYFKPYNYINEKLKRIL